MTKAIVNADAGLNLREKPGGTKIGSLSKGTIVELLNLDEGWWKIRAGRQSGFVSARYVTAIPDKEVVKPGSIVVRGRDVIGPDGRVFAKTFRKGVFNYGRMSIHDYVTDNADRFTHLSDSLLRVMQAVSANEGKLEAINTWDNAYLTFGCFQWTAGTGDSAGELPALIHRLKRDKPEVFGKFFEGAGLDVVDVSDSTRSVSRGRFSVKGRVLRTARDKEVLRGHDWAYRFWSAGEDEDFREVQIHHAMSRLGTFYRHSGKQILGRPIADYITSQYGVALLLDQHVNRPGHVPKVLAQGIDQFIRDGGEQAPEKWSIADELRVLDLYLELRHNTTMTDSRKRAQRTLDSVRLGLASDQRGSFADATTET
jgi:hypothetical protein